MVLAWHVAIVIYPDESGLLWQNPLHLEFDPQTLKPSALKQTLWASMSF